MHAKLRDKKLNIWDFPGSPVIKILSSMQRMQVRYLVGELRSHMSCSQKKQNIKEKQCCDKFREDFKMVHIKKKEIFLKLNIVKVLTRSVFTVSDRYLGDGSLQT